MSLAFSKNSENSIASGGGTIEYRFRHRRGHYIWIQDTFTATKDKDGNPKELIGSWADISDRKKIETELKRLAGEVEDSQSVHSRNFRPLSDGRGCHNTARFAQRTSDGRRKTQDHDVDGGP